MALLCVVASLQSVLSLPTAYEWSSITAPLTYKQQKQRLRQEKLRQEEAHSPADEDDHTDTLETHSRNTQESKQQRTKDTSPYLRHDSEDEEEAVKLPESAAPLNKKSTEGVTKFKSYSKVSRHPVTLVEVKTDNIIPSDRVEQSEKTAEVILIPQDRQEEEDAETLPFAGEYINIFFYIYF